MKLKDLHESKQISLARSMAKQLVDAARRQHPESDKKAMATAFAGADEFVKHLKQEISNYNKESTFIQK